MINNKKSRQYIHYSLIAGTLLIQLIISVFLYNEYFNNQKLEAIEKELQEIRVLESLTADSRLELLKAQDNLQKYADQQDKKFLEAYFNSLRKLSSNLDSIASNPNLNPAVKKIIASRKKELSALPNLNSLIRTVYRESQKPAPTKKPLEIKNFEVENITTTSKTEIEHRSDSVQQKRFFSRLKDAIKNDVKVKREITVITTKYGDSVDTGQIKSDIDSIISAVHNHYSREIEKYEAGLASAESQNTSFYRIYDRLIMFSNNWMEIYNFAISDFSKNLEKQYDEQNSVNNKIRKYTVTGLMVLMFLVLLLIIHYTRLSFLYQRELKAAYEEINRNLNFKQRILGMLSHEIRAPLKIINLFIDRISRKTNDTGIEGYLKSIKFTNSSLLIQATQILEYTKNQEQKIELMPVRFNLREEMEAILKAFQPYIESRNNVFDISNETADITVFADNTKIYQLFINILGNANKFTEDGRISVKISTSVMRPGLLLLSVSVSDTGAGISERDLKKIFEPYYQGAMPDGIENLGAGLGLNLCREIVRLFHGTISAESTLGEGTTVSFKINLNIDR